MECPVCKKTFGERNLPRASKYVRDHARRVGDEAHLKWIADTQQANATSGAAVDPTLEHKRMLSRNRVARWRARRRNNNNNNNNNNENSGSGIRGSSEHADDASGDHDVSMSNMEMDAYDADRDIPKTQHGQSKGRLGYGSGGNNNSNNNNDGNEADDDCETIEKRHQNAIEDDEIVIHTRKLVAFHKQNDEMSIPRIPQISSPSTTQPQQHQRQAAQQQAQQLPPTSKLNNAVLTSLRTPPSPSQSPTSTTIVTTAAMMTHQHKPNDLIEMPAIAHQQFYNEPVPQSGKTPLHHAARGGHEKVVDLLLEKGFDINSRTVEGKTPLYFAAEMGHEGVVKALLRGGADKRLRTVLGLSALDVAAENGNEIVVALLL